MKNNGYEKRWTDPTVQEDYQAPMAELATESRPGSSERIAAYRERAMAGEQIFHPADGRGPAVLGYGDRPRTSTGGRHFNTLRVSGRCIWEPT